MASICTRLLRQTLRPNYLVSCRNFADKLMDDPLEHATGIEKRELLAHAAGNTDPFNLKVLKRGPGTKDQPTAVPSANNARIVGCVCEEDAGSITWMWLHKGSPKRCECGHWYKLVEQKPI